MPTFDDATRDAIYTQCCEAISAAGPQRESLFLARLALLLLHEVGDGTRCCALIEQALHELPQPSLSRQSA